MITALLHSRDVHIAPGASAEIVLDLVNNGRDPILPRINVSGAPPGVVAVPQLTQPIAPGETRRTSLGFVVPRTFSSGRHQLSLRVHIDGVESDSTAVSFTLSVLALDNVAISINPASVRGRWRGRFKVVLHNRSNAPTELDLTSQSDDVSVTFKPKRVRVRPGERTTTRAVVRSKPVLFSTSSRKPFTVFAQAQSRPLQTGAVFSQRPLIGGFARRGVLILAMLALAVGGVRLTLDLLRNEGDDQVSSDTLSETADDAGGDGSGSEGSGGAAGSSDGSGDGTDGTDATATGQVSLADESEPSGVEIQLRPISLNDPISPNTKIVNDSTDRGTADRSNAKSLAWVTQHVRAQQGNSQPISIITGESGTWKHSSLVPGGHYELLFSKLGYTSQAFVVSPVEIGEQLELEVVLTPGNGALGGTVTDGSRGIGGAKVTITDGTLIYTATTSTEPGQIGQWEIEGIGTPARYVLTVEMPGFGAEVRSVDLGPGGSDQSVSTRLTSGVGSIIGTVSNGGIGQGGITVIVTGGDVSLTTTSLSDDPVGTFALPQLPLGITYTLEASGPGWLTQTQDVFVDGAETVFIQLISSTGRLQGTIESDTPANPAQPGLGDVRVTVTGNDLEFATTSADTGEYTFPAVPPGEYVVTFDRFEHLPQAIPVILYAGITTTQDVTLEFAPHTVPRANARLFGKITNQRNEDVGGAIVTVLGHAPTALSPGDDGNGNLQVTADGTGNYDIQGLDFGAYTVRIQASQHQLSDSSESFSLDAEIERDRQLFTLGSFEGHVRPSWDINQTLGIDAASVFVTNGSTVIPDTTAFVAGEGYGYYAISDTLTPGDWTVSATVQGFVGESTTATAGRLGETTVVPDLYLHLRPSLEVLVVAPQNDGTFDPIENAVVTLTTAPADYSGDVALTTDATGEVAYIEPRSGVVPATTPSPVPGSYIFSVTAAGYESAVGLGAVLIPTPAASQTPATTRLQVALVPSALPGAGYLVGGTISYQRDGADHPINGARVQATVISSFDTSVDPAEPTAVTTPIDITFPTDVWSVPQHRHGDANYTFSQADFHTLIQAINASADLGGGPNNDLAIMLSPLASSITGSVAHSTVGAVDTSQFQIVASSATMPGAGTQTIDILAGGAYTVPSLVPGTWDFNLQHDSGNNARFTFPTQFSFNLGPNDNRLLAAPLTIVEKVDLTVNVTSVLPEQASISLYNGANLIATMTDPGNIVTFTNLDPGIAFFLDVSAVRHETKIVPVAALSPGGDTTVVVDLEAWATVSGHVSGRIGTAVPVDRNLDLVTVTLTDVLGLLTPVSYNTTTAADGTWSLQVPAATWAITYARTDYGSNPVTPAVNIVAVNDTSYPQGTAVLLVTPVDVQFQILSDETDAGGAQLILNGATISLTHATESAGANQIQPATGFVTFASLQTVTWQVTITAANHSTTVYNLVVDPGGLVGPEVITLNRNQSTIHFEATARVNVGGNKSIGPIENVRIEFPDNSGKFYLTANDGTYDLNNVENRNYKKIDFDAEPGVYPNLKYSFEMINVNVSAQPSTVNAPAVLDAVDGQIDLTVTQVNANTAADFTNLDAQLYFVTVAGGEVAHGTAQQIGADKTHSFTVPPSKPDTLASGNRLHYWEIRLTGTGFADTISVPIDVNPNATSAISVPINTTPTSPAGLGLTTSAGQFVATWTAVPVAANGGTPVTDYTVEWGPTGGAFPNSLDTGGPTTLIVTTNFSAGDTIDVRVRAKNSVGSSAPGTVEMITIPDTPGQVSDLAVTVSAVGQLTATWSAPAANGSAITSYELQRRLSTGSWGTPADVTIVDPATSPTVVSSLTPNLTYVFRVRAVNAVGNGAWSSDMSEKAVGVPGAPTITTVTAASGQLTVNWTAPASNGGSAITDYEVSATDGGTPVTAMTGDTSLTLDVGGLTNGADYTVTVRAKNSDFWGAFSTGSSPHTPLGVPGAPTVLTLTPTADGFTATWTDPADDGGNGDDLGNYQYRVEDVAGVVVEWTTTASSTPSYTITGLDPHDYIVKVRATNALHTGMGTASQTGTVPT